MRPPAAALNATGDNPERRDNEASFATLCRTSQVEASSAGPGGVD
ncbi:hypothetical protein [Streptomyces sp. WELS2]|nr:hypothetical protein [Streptomyces sp. WELS2]